MATSRKSSGDASVSPTTGTTKFTAIAVGNQAVRASSFGGDASSFKLAGVPSWAGPARASGAGINGDPFNTSADESFDAFAGLRGAAATFKPDSNGQQSAKMTSLTYNSFVDDGPTIVTSAPAARITFQEPIGTKSGSSTSPVRAKVFFTTDVNPNKPQMGGRFLLVEGLADKDLADHGIISIIDRQFAKAIRGSKLFKPVGDGEHHSWLIFMNDIRDASKLFSELDSNAKLSTSYVSYDWYAAGTGTRPGSIEPKGLYIGQLTLVAEYKGRSAEFNPSIDAFDKIKYFAASFGDLVAFDQIPSAIYPKWEFRAEYYKVSSAESAIEEASNGFKLSEGWIVTVKQYMPPSYSPVSPQDGFGEFDNTGALITTAPNGAPVILSPTGRTAWYKDADGVDHPVTPPRTVANAERSTHEPPTTPENTTALQLYDSEPQIRRSSLRLYGPNNGMAMQQYNYGGDNSEAGHQSQDVSIDRIVEGSDVRTTIMMRNIPNHWHWRQLKAKLDATGAHRFNFTYLRIDFRENKNVGYAFVNFEDAFDIVRFVEAFVGKPWDPAHHSGGKVKYAQVSYATIQGLDCLIEKFRNSSIMDELPDYRPMLWQTVEERNKELAIAEKGHNPGHQASMVAPVGVCKRFPEPNNRAKKERSTANAGHIGLFTPRSRANGQDRSHRSQYDRGTPHQLFEDAVHHHQHAVMPQTSYGPYPQPQVMMPPPQQPMAGYTWGAPRPQAVYPPTFGHHMQMQMAPYHPGYMTAPANVFMNGQGRGTFQPSTPTRPYGPGPYMQNANMQHTHMQNARMPPRGGRQLWVPNGNTNNNGTARASV